MTAERGATAECAYVYPGRHEKAGLQCDVEEAHWFHDLRDPLPQACLNSPSGCSHHDFVPAKQEAPYVVNPVLAAGRIRDLAPEDIDRRFDHHAPSGYKIERHAEVRAKFKALATELALLLPSGREKSLAFTDLEQALMWANAAIAREDSWSKEPG